MDKARGLEEDVDVLVNIDSEDNDTEDDELASVLRCSREEHECLQNRKGTESSNEASGRNRPAMVLGAGALSIPPIARLSRPPHQKSTESFLRMVNPPFHLD